MAILREVTENLVFISILICLNGIRKTELDYSKAESDTMIQNQI